MSNTTTSYSPLWPLSSCSQQLARAISTALGFLLLSIAMPFESDAQSSSGSRISGRIIDAENGEGIVGAAVALEVNQRTLTGCVTNVDGRFSMTVAYRGNATLSVRSLGYEPSTREIEIGPSGVADVRFELIGKAFHGEPIVVIGQSYKAQRKLAGTGTQVDPKTIRLVNPIGTQEMLEYVPGVNGFADDGMGNSRLNIGIRGLNPRRSSRVLVLEDGIPIQPAPYIYANMYYNPPTERIERIEVLKGSAAIEYGPQTMGGVVNYITSRPRSEFGGRVDLTGGTNGFLSTFAEIGGLGNDVVRSDLQLLFKRGDGFRDNNEFNQYNGTLKFTIVPDAEKTLYVKANGNYEVSNATYTGLTEYSFENDPEFNPKEDDEFLVWRFALDAIYTEALSDNLTASTKTYLNIFDRRWWRENDIFVKASEFENDPIDPTPAPWFETGDLVRTGNGLNNFGILRRFNSMGVEQAYHLTHSLAGYPLETRIGGRLHWERFKDDKVTGDAPDAREGLFYTGNPEDSTLNIVGSSDHYQTTALALYAHEGWTLGDLTLSLGARFEVFEQEQIDRLHGAIYSDRTSMVFLPGLGVNYEIGDINLFGGVHRGYTPPSSGALKVLDFGAASSTGGLDLESEKSWNSEVGLRGAYSWIGFEVAAFVISIEDMVAAGRGTVFKNLGKVQTRGVEVGGNIRSSTLSNLLPDLNLSYTFLNTEVIDGTIPSAILAGEAEVDISGNELPYAPHHTLTAGLAREFDFGLTVRADMHLVTESFTDFENIESTSNRGDTGPIPGYTTFSASAAWKVSDRWRVSITGKNLTDEVYIGSRLHSNPRQPEASLSSGILPGPRRQINMGVGYSFGAE